MKLKYLALIAAAGLLAGCNQSDKTSDQSTATPTPNSAAAGAQTNTPAVTAPATGTTNMNK